LNKKLCIIVAIALCISVTESWAGALRVESMALMSNYLEDSNSIFSWPGSQEFYSDYSSISFGDFVDIRNSDMYTGFVVNKRINSISSLGFGLDASNGEQRRTVSLSRKFRKIYSALTVNNSAKGQTVYSYGVRSDISDNTFADFVVGSGNRPDDSFSKFRLFFSPTEKIIFIPFYSWSESNSSIKMDFQDGVNQRIGLGANLLTDGDTLIALAVERNTGLDNNDLIFYLAAERRWNALLSLRTGYKHQEVLDLLTAGIALHVMSCDIEAVIKKSWIEEVDCISQASIGAEDISIGVSVSVWHSLY
jgi:hypothetical protein